MGEPGLNGLRVFVVEDESLVAMMIEDMLVDMGCTVADVACHVEDALAKISSLTFDAAVVDVNLNGSRSFQVAEKLFERRVPFVLSTGYGYSGVPDRLRGVPLVVKPFRWKDLRQALQAALSLHAGGAQ